MTEERAVLAGGCFWGMQDLIRRYDGVVSTRVGYAERWRQSMKREVIRVVRDYGMFDQREAPQYYPDVPRPASVEARS